LSRIAKIDDKVAADQRGHGLGISLEVYSISDLQQKIEAVKRLESEVIQFSNETRDSGEGGKPRKRRFTRSREEKRSKRSNA